MIHGINNFSAPVGIRQTARTAAGNAVWAMTSAPIATAENVLIHEITLLIGYCSTTINNSLIGYSLTKFSNATPTGGTAIIASPQDTNNAATVITDIRFLDTGLTTTGIIRGAPIAHITLPTTNGATNMYRRTFTSISLDPGEGLLIDLFLTAEIGLVLSGEIIWSE